MILESTNSISTLKLKALSKNNKVRENIAINDYNNDVYKELKMYYYKNSNK